MTGDNTSNLLQVLGQSEVGKGAPTINQLQNVALRPTQCPNVEDLSAHVCASVDQNTTAGRDVSRIAQPYREFQSARNTGGGQQVQGDTTDPAKAGGLDHVVNQVGAQKSDIFTGQNAVQLQLTRNVGTMTQFQDPPIRKGLGSTQTATADSTWTGVQRLVQIQRMDGVSMGNQTALESYECFTTGLCTVNQSVNQNGAVTTNSCGPTSFCQTEITCEAVSEESGGCVAPPPVTSCSEGTFFDPTTGQCEEEIE
ncbi:MAG: hypothetical protein E6G60_00630 [Actinobacteria bacterium]|nr:MAG: hypothetical protein E6G60_00630 [Actinomycetota bacterium]